MSLEEEIRALLERLDAAGVTYAALRSYDEVLSGDVQGGGDLDVLVSEADAAKLCEALDRGGDTGVRKLQRRVYGEGEVFALDFHVGTATGSGISYFLEEEALSQRQKKEWLYVLSPEHELLLLVVRELVAERRFTSEYRRRITELYDERREAFYEERLAGLFGKRAARRIVGCLRAEQFDALERTGYAWLFFFRHPSNWTAYFSAAARLAYRTLVPRKCPLVSFIGMDGAGKTTVSRAVSERLRGMGFRVRRVYAGRGRDNILPLDVFSKGYVRMGGEPGVKTDERERSFSLAHTLAAPVYALDLGLRYVFRVWPARKKFDFVVTDRYATDVLLTNKVPAWVRRALFSCFPRPSLAVYLYDDPAVLAERKNHPLPDLRRQQRVYEGIVELLGAHRVRADGVPSTVEEAVRVVLEHG